MFCTDFYVAQTYPAVFISATAIYKLADFLRLDNKIPRTVSIVFHDPSDVVKLIIEIAEKGDTDASSVARARDVSAGAQAG